MTMQANRTFYLCLDPQDQDTEVEIRSGVVVSDDPPAVLRAPAYFTSITPTEVRGDGPTVPPAAARTRRPRGG